MGQHACSGIVCCPDVARRKYDGQTVAHRQDFKGVMRRRPRGKRLDIMDAIVPGFGVRVTDKADEKGKAAQCTFILVARFPGFDTPGPARYWRIWKTFPWTRLETRPASGTNSSAEEWTPSKRKVKERAIEQERRDNTFEFVAEEFIKRHLKGPTKSRCLREGNSQGIDWTLG